MTVTKCVVYWSCLALSQALSFAQSASATDSASPSLPTPRPPPRTLDTPRQFPTIASLEEWKSRAREIREQILVSCGLWPKPPRTPLNSHIFGKMEREGYSIEKVYFETYPGFYLAGNLYRPLGRGRGPFPGVLNPHGHWTEGRMADNNDGSIAARCISLARQGMVAFSYDMVGYNDTHFADAPTGQDFSVTHHQFATNRADLLWSISLMGLQTWNSIRALDFLESLPDVDRRRLACTGESGGGTQTFMLGALDDRLAAQAPVVMVSHIMQGGCLCENAPGLRVEYSNMEIAAAAAPRPQILVAATGDWTRDTLSVEGPSIESIYRLFRAPGSFDYVRFNFGHNYNQTSRETVYGWLGKWLLKRADASPVQELPAHKEPDSELRVFPDDRLPAGALTQAQFIEFLRRLHQRQWQALVPRDEAGLRRFREVMLPCWRHTLQLEWPLAYLERRFFEEQLSNQVAKRASESRSSFSRVDVSLRRWGETSTVLATFRAPLGEAARRHPALVVVCSPREGRQPSAPNVGPSGLARDLLERGLAVLEVEQFSSSDPGDQFGNFFTTYNRTKVQERVRDLVALCAAARALEPRRVLLAGTGHAGLWALLAAPAADAVIADCDSLNPTDENQLLADDRFCPGLLNLGGFAGPAMLVAPHPLCLHDIGPDFRTDDLRAAFAASGEPGRLKIESGLLPTAASAAWAAEAAQ